MKKIDPMSFLSDAYLHADNAQTAQRPQYAIEHGGPAYAKITHDDPTVPAIAPPPVTLEEVGLAEETTCDDPIICPDTSGDDKVVTDIIICRDISGDDKVVTDVIICRDPGETSKPVVKDVSDTPVICWISPDEVEISGGGPLLHDLNPLEPNIAPPPVTFDEVSLLPRHHDITDPTVPATAPPPVTIEDAGTLAGNTSTKGETNFICLVAPPIEDILDGGQLDMGFNSADAQGALNSFISETGGYAAPAANAPAAYYGLAPVESQQILADDMLAIAA